MSVPSGAVDAFALFLVVPGPTSCVISKPPLSSVSSPVARKAATAGTARPARLALTSLCATPVRREICPEGQVCVSITPGSGGVCMLACISDDPEPCVNDGIVTGTYKAFSNNEVHACNNPDNVPVCPPS